VSQSRTVASALALLATACACPLPPEPRPPPPVTSSPSPPAPVTVTATEDGVPKPVMRQENYRIEAGAYALEVSPSTGANIVEFSLDGRNVLASREDSPNAFGSTFYPSPQSDWQWPPPPEWDALPWTVAVHGRRLDLKSRAIEKTGLGATQSISLDGAKGAARIDYRIINHGSTPHRVAPWQNTRVRPKGLTFFPCSRPVLPQSSLKLEPNDGVIWFQHDPADFAESKKLFADGNEGWLAQVDGDLMFVKVFPDVPPEQQAPGEAEIEIYVDRAGRFVEVEQQGPYVEYGDGHSSTWTVQWVVRKLPSDIHALPERKGLVSFARELAASVR